MTEFEDIFTALSQGGVDFVAVGGVAVVLQGYPRLTLDLNLVVSLEPANALRAIRALTSLGFRPRAPVAAEDFADASVRQQWIDDKGMLVFSLTSERHPMTAVDLFVTEPVPYDGLKARMTQVRVASAAVAVASIEDLIAMKEKAGRPKDLLDIEQLRRVLKASEGAKP
jgi:hypothetical protein